MESFHCKTLYLCTKQLSYTHFLSSLSNEHPLSKEEYNGIITGLWITSSEEVST